MQNQLRCIKTVALKLSPLGTMCCSIPLLLMFHLSVAKNGKLQGTGTSERLCAASISSAVDAKGWGGRRGWLSTRAPRQVPAGPMHLLHPSRTQALQAHLLGFESLWVLCG